MRDSFFTYAEPCENCGTPCECRTWVEGFEYWGCEDCAEEARLTIAAEQCCEPLYAAVLRAKCAADVRRAFAAHDEAECEACLRKRRDTASRGPGRETGERKEKAA